MSQIGRGKILLDVRRQDILFGLRLTASGLLPLLIGVLIRQPELGSSAFLGGLYAAQTDTGGPYRRRVLAMSSATTAMALATFLASLAGALVWLAIALMFLCAVAGAMLAIYGNTASKIGFVITGVFLITLAEPASPQIALARLVAVIFGGVCALLLSLWSWPFRPYQPARAAIAAYYQALAALLTSITDTETPRRPGAYPISQERKNVLDAQNSAYEMLVAIRATQEGASSLGQQLLQLTLLADRLYAAIITFATGLAHGSSSTISRPLSQRHELATALELTTRVLRQIATALTHDTRTVDTHMLYQARQMLTAPPSVPFISSQDAHARTRRRHMVRAWQYIEESIQNAAALLERPLGEDQSGQYHLFASPYMLTRERFWQLLRENLSMQSLAFRHALRLGVATALGVAIYTFFHLPHGYWLPLTIMIILKPDFGGTRQRLFQRVGGTVLGGMIAALLAAIIYNPLLLYLLVFLLGFGAFTYYTRHYAIFVVFLTPFIVLVLDLAQPGNWEIALIRMLNTLLGGVIAFLAGYLFWPQWERERLPAQLARAITASRTLLDAALPIWYGKPVDNEALFRASREAHLQDINAATAFQRLLSEPRAQRGDVKRFYTLLSYNRHLCDRLTALALYRTKLASSPILPELKHFNEYCDKIAQCVAEAVRTGQPVDPRHHLLARLEASLQTIRATLPGTSAAQTAHLAAARAATDRSGSLLALQLVGIARDISDMYRLLSDGAIEREETAVTARAAG